MGKNMARAKSAVVFKTVEAEFSRLDEEVRELELKLDQRGTAADRQPGSVSPAQVVEQAMQLLENLGDCSDDQASRQWLGELLRRLEVRLWLKFKDNPRDKRPKRVLGSGVVTAGDIAPKTIHMQFGGDCLPVAGGGDGSVYPVAEMLPLPIANGRADL
ncbi:MAG: hypothetical protein WD851_13285 [Pirellulales bacterium]